MPEKFVKDPLYVRAPVDALGEPVVALAVSELPETVLESDCVDITILCVELSVLCELFVELLVLVLVSTERSELSVVVTL